MLLTSVHLNNFKIHIKFVNSFSRRKVLSDLDDNFNPTGSGVDFGVFDQWPEVY